MTKQVYPHVCLKIIFCLIFYFALCPAISAMAKQELRGKVYILGQNDERRPVTNTTVRIQGTDDSDITTSTGMFKIYLPDVFKTGETVTLEVEKPKCQILHPLAGGVRIPANSLKNPVEVVLDKEGSHRFMSNKAFALLIENIANKPKQQVKTDDERKELDLSRYLKEWAIKYGFGIDHVRAELDKWAADVETRQENLHELALAAFYKKKFGEAADRSYQSAKQYEEQLATVLEKEKGIEGKKQQLKEKIVRDYRLAGDAHYNDYRFKEALDAYQKALAETDKAAAPQAWASLMNNISNTYSNLGTRSEGSVHRLYLNKAVDGYSAILKIYTRETLPQDWAMTQNNIGNALQNQGIRTGGEEGAKLLGKAVEAYNAALTVRTHEILPQDWAMTQNNMGIALKEQALRSAYGQKHELFQRAVTAFKNALEVRTYKHLPLQWAQTHNNLAETYYLREDWAYAAECYCNVLKVYPKYDMAYERANSIYHERLFQFEKAYELNFDWVIKFKNVSNSSKSKFIETNFTTARFDKTEELLSELVPKLDSNNRLYAPLCALEIANLVALKKTDAVSGKLDKLISAIKQQSEDYTIGWTFNGVKHFINTSENLKPDRQWLLSFFAAIESPNRDAIVKGLQNVQKDLNEKNQRH